MEALSVSPVLNSASILASVWPVIAPGGWKEPALVPVHDDDDARCRVRMRAPHLLTPSEPRPASPWVPDLGEITGQRQSEAAVCSMIACRNFGVSYVHLTLDTPKTSCSMHNLFI